MKKVFAVIFSFLLLILTGCNSNLLSNPATHEVSHLKNWKFQYNDSTNDYSLFFGLADENGKEISDDVRVDIRIESEDGTVVYTGSKYVSSNKFGSYSNIIDGERYFANVKIPENEIAKGNSSSGKVYFKVYKTNAYTFNEQNCKAYDCLPIFDINVKAEILPVEIALKGYDGTISSKIRIDKITYEYKKDFPAGLNITVYGEKTFGNSKNNSFDTINYKLYDQDGYMINSGDFMLESLSKGDKFKKDLSAVRDVIPGKNYTVKFYSND